MSGRTTSGPLARTVSVAEQVRLSAAAGGLVTVVGAVAVGLRLVGPRLTALALAAGVGTAVALVMLTSGRSGTAFAGGVAVTLASTLLATALGVAVGFGVETRAAIGHLATAVVLSLALAGFAAVLTASPADEASALADGFNRVVGLFVATTTAGVAAVTIATGGSVAVALANLVVDSPEPLLALARTLFAPTGRAALLTLFLYAIVAVALLRFVLASLPVATLFPPRRRSAVAARVESATETLNWVLLGSTVTAVAVTVSALLTGVDTPTAIADRLGPPVGDPLARLLTAVWPRVALLLVVGALLAVLAGERVRRRVRRRSGATLVRAGLPTAGALAATVVCAAGLAAAVTPETALAGVPATVRPLASPLLERGVVPAALAAGLWALVLGSGLLLLLAVLAGSPVLPERALGPALAAGTVFALALSLVFLDGASPRALAAAALALVVWDAGEFATGLREELPPGAATTRAELVHVGGTLGVGLIAVSATVLLDRFVASGVARPAAEQTLAAGALALAFAVTVVLLSVLRS